MCPPGAGQGPGSSLVGWGVWICLGGKRGPEALRPMWSRGRGQLGRMGVVWALWRPSYGEVGASTNRRQGLWAECGFQPSPQPQRCFQSWGLLWGSARAQDTAGVSPLAFAGKVVATASFPESRRDLQSRPGRAGSAEGRQWEGGAAMWPPSRASEMSRLRGHHKDPGSVSGWGMGRQEGRRGRLGQACLPGPAGLPGGGPWPDPWAAASRQTERASGGRHRAWLWGSFLETAGRPVPTCPHHVVLVTWNHVLLATASVRAEASPQWESRVPLPSPNSQVLAPTPTAPLVAWPSDPGHTPSTVTLLAPQPCLDRGLAKPPGAVPAVSHCSLCEGGLAPTFPTHVPSPEACQLFQASGHPRLS